MTTPSVSQSSRPMRWLGRASLATIIVSGCAAAVHPAAGPTPLHLLLSGRASAPMAASMSGAAGAAGSGVAGAFVLTGTLPTTPTSAAIYDWLPGGTLPDTSVIALGRTFGITGTPVRHAYGWVLTMGSSEVRLRDGAGGQWSMTTSTDTCGIGVVDVDQAAQWGTTGCGVAVATGSSATSTSPNAIAGSAGAAPAGTAAAPPATTSPGAPTPVPSPPAGTPIPIDQPVVPDALARTIADPVLAALGVTGRENVYPGLGTAEVVVSPKVDNFPTLGIETTIQVDRTSVVAASGWLTPPLADTTYPLVTADAAFATLAQRPMNMMAIACPASTDPTVTPPPCPSPSPVSITGGELGLSLNWDQSGAPLLVPTWFFTVADSTDPITAIAVDPAYLATPTPTDTSVGTNSGGSGAPIPPGTPVPPVAGGSAVPVASPTA